MHIFVLSAYFLKRILKHKVTFAALYLAPLIMALLKIVYLPSKLPNWAPLVICAVFSCAVFLLQHTSDQDSGFNAELKTAVLTEYDIAFARCLSALLVFAVQAALFIIVSYIKIH